MEIRRSERKKAKIKLALQGSAGSGKTYSSLLIAKGLVRGDFTKTAIIDTENRSADLYAHLVDYNVVSLEPPYSPERYIEAIELCEKAGMKVIIIDSISHCWDFLLDVHSNMLGNSFTNWGKVTPRQNAFVNKMLRSNSHIISTMRVKQDYVFSFMYPRLRLAKDLLKEDGVIFISIDENENENLLKICEEIFGEENVVGSIPVIMNLKGNQDSYGFADTHEYIVVCTKQKIDFEFGQLDIDEETIFKDWETDDWGLFKEADNLRATGVNAPREKRPNLWYPIFLNENTKDFYVTDDNLPINDSDVKILPVNPEGKELSWYWGKKKFNFKKYNLILKETSNGYQFYKKQRPQLGDIPTKKPKSVLYSSSYSTSTSTTHLKNLFGAKIFQAPKPVPFLIDLILIALKSDCSSKSEVILDFFAGSGSSGHAVHRFNYFKDTAHKYLLVQLPEVIEDNEEAFKLGYKKISDISKERIRRAIKQIDENQGFKVYKQDTSTIYKWQEFVPDLDGALPDLFNNLELAYKNPLQDGVTTQDFITEVILQEGFPLTAKQEEVVSGIFKITHEWVPYTLYATMLYSFKDTDFSKLHLQETDHFVCLDKAFEGNDALKQELDNLCKIFTI